MLRGMRLDRPSCKITKNGFAAVIMTLLMLLFISGEATAAIYYMSPSGNDRNAGTSTSAPWATFGHAMAALQPGDTLYLMDGTYVQYLHVTKSGAAGNYITIKALNDGKAIVDGQGGFLPCAIDGQAYVDMEGIVCQNSSSNALYVGVRGSDDAAAHDIILRRVSAYRAVNHNATIMIDGVDNTRAYNILLEDCVASSPTGTGYIAIDTISANAVTLRRCFVYNTDPGIVFYETNNSTMENNVAFFQPATSQSQPYGTTWGMTVNATSHDQGFNDTFTGNIVRGNTTGQTFYSGFGITDRVNGQLIGNNTTMTNNVSINTTYFGITQNAGTNVLLSNNTAVQTRTDLPSSAGYGLIHLQTWCFASGVTNRETLQSHVINNSMVGNANSNEYGLIVNNSGRSTGGVSVANTYNNFFNINEHLYGGTVSTGSGDKTMSPSYDTATYGYGAYLMVPQALQGAGANGGDIGAEVLYQYKDGVLTNTPLWPWPMEDRILKELGISVTWAAQGGLWMTLNGLYTTGTSTPDSTAPSVPSVLTATATTMANTIAPVITSFTVPATSTSLTLAGISVTGTDNVGVTGYMVNESSTQPAATATGWTASAPVSYTFSTPGSKTLYAWAKNAAGYVSASSSASVTITLPDTTAPSVPTGGTATAVSSSQINITWSASTDPSITGQTTSGLAGYKIYQNGTQIAITTATSYSAAGLSASTSYSFTIAAYDAAGNTSTQSSAVSATTQVAPSAPSTVAISINSGGTQYTDSATIAYMADTYYTRGATTSTSSTIAGTTDSTLYQTVRYGNFSYNIPLANGNYNVTLKFAEIYWKTAGSRIFNVSMQNNPVLSNFDIIAKAGKNNTAYDVTIPVSITNGVLNIQFSSVKDYAMVNAIEVIPITAADTTAPSAPTSLSATAVSTSQINLTWAASADSVVSGQVTSGVAGYKVYRNGVQIATTTTTNYSDIGLTLPASYSYTIIAYDVAGNSSAPSNVVTTDTEAVPPVVSQSGVVYRADVSSTRGAVASTSATIAGTTDSTLYQTIRYGNFSYNIPLPNGNYNVTLKFAETYWTAAGQRVFNVSMQGQTVISNLDVVARAGDNNTAYDVTVPVSVANGVLSVAFSSVKDYAIVSAIVVKSGQTPVFAVNAGGIQYTDRSGIVYNGDIDYAGGILTSTAAAISGTTDPSLYQIQRLGNFSAHIPLANGNYTVTLKFAEIYWTDAGRRLFNVAVNGTQVISNLDVYAKVGQNAAYDVAVPVTVTNGMLDIIFTTVKDNAIINSIVITPN